MSSLRHIERIKFEKLLEMGGGYVLDFSDRTFRDFVLENTNIDVYAPGYEEGGTSKANRLRTFWKKENDSVVAKLTEELLEYWRTQKLISSKDLAANEKDLYQKCLQVVLRLKGQNTPVEHKPPLMQGTHPGVFIAAKEIKNDGFIEGPQVDIFTDSYSGKGKISSPAPNQPISISHSNVHFGQGNNIGFNKNVQDAFNDIPLWLKWTVAIVTILTLLWGFYIYFFPSLSFSNIDTINSQETLGTSTSTPNLANILAKNNTLSTSVEKQDFIKKYSNTTVYGFGSFLDIIKMDRGYIVLMTIANNEVGCQFGFDSEKELLLFVKGHTVHFSGLFTGGGLGGYGAVNPWYITDCTLLN